MTIQIINKTPHDVVVFMPSGQQQVFNANFPPARVKSTMTSVGSILGIPLMQPSFGKKIDNLPEPTDGTFFIVSLITAQAAKANGRGTSDLLLTTDLVRDDSGKVIGVRAFAPFS